MKATVEEAQGIADLSPYAAEIGKGITALEYLTTELLAATAEDDSFLAHSWASPYLEIVGDVVHGVDADLAGGHCCTKKSKRATAMKTIIRQKS